MRKQATRSRRAAVPVEDEDSDTAAGRLSDPDADDIENDEIDNFHTRRDKLLLEQGASLEPADSSSDQDSVLGLDIDDDDEDDDDDTGELGKYRRQLAVLRKQKVHEEMGSDLEDEGSDDSDGSQLDGKSWGKRRAKYYGAENEDAADASGSEPETQALEEEEARRLQKRMALELGDQDFDLDIFAEAAKKSTEEKASSAEKVSVDLSQLSRTEKRRLLKKECPELLELIQQFTTRLEEVKSQLAPLNALQKEGELPASSGVVYITTKLSLLLNYCINIGFYLVLRAKRQFTPHHPVVRRLVQYRNLLKQLETVDASIQPEMQKLLGALEDGEDIQNLLKKRSRAPSSGIKRRKLLHVASGKQAAKEEETTDSKTGAPPTKVMKPIGVDFQTSGERQALEYYDMMRAGRDEKDAAEGGDEMEGEESGEERVTQDLTEEEMELGKRGITFQMAKNKGLMPKRKKEQRNPRVKYRMKFRKANIRRKGQVRVVRKELKPYGGELSGIRAGIQRSIKLK